jgi:hypothetical protein
MPAKKKHLHAEDEPKGRPRQPVPGVAKLETPSEVTISVRVTHDLKASLQAAADMQGASVSDLLRDQFHAILGGTVVPRGLRTVTVETPAMTDLEAVAQLRVVGGAMVSLLGRRTWSAKDEAEVRATMIRVRAVAKRLEGALR